MHGAPSIEERSPAPPRHPQAGSDAGLGELAAQAWQSFRDVALEFGELFAAEARLAAFSLFVIIALAATFAFLAVGTWLLLLGALVLYLVELGWSPAGGVATVAVLSGVTSVIVALLAVRTTRHVRFTRTRAGLAHTLGRANADAPTQSPS